jgi:hypothetical protein
MEPTAMLGQAVNGLNTAGDTLVELLVRQQNLYLMAAVYALLTTIQKVLPPDYSDHHLSVRLAPLYPLILCSAGVWLPGQQPDDMGSSSKVLVGLILGYACGQANKIWKQTIKGKDSRIEAAREAKRQNAAEATAAAGADVPPDAGGLT